MSSQNPDFIGDVREFMQACGQADQLAGRCKLPPQNIRELRRSLIESEHQEFVEGWEKNDIPEIADALADLIYVIVGAAIAYGIPLDKVWRAVQTANMSKLWTWDEVLTLGTLFPNPPSVDFEFKLGNGWKCNRVLVPSLGVVRYAVKDELGKVRKPPSWKEPDIKAIIDEATLLPEQEANRAKWKEAIAREEALAISQKADAIPNQNR